MSLSHSAICFIAPALPTKATEIIEGSVTGFVRPAYAVLHERASALSVVKTLRCTVAGQPAWRATVSKRDRRLIYAEIIRIGPINEQNRLERMLFWPDRAGIGLSRCRQRSRLLDATAADPQLPTGVAMQGLGALEFVLFGTGADALSSRAIPTAADGAAVRQHCDDGRRCHAACARTCFAGYGQTPPGNPFTKPAPSVTELLGVFVNGLELVRDVRVGGFLGKEAADDKPRQAIYWRSDGTARSLAANMAGMKALFEASGLGDQLSLDMHWIADSIKFEFGNAIDAANAADGPIDETLADEKNPGKLSYFNVVTSSLSEPFCKRPAA